jgi:hypothetical protein
VVDHFASIMGSDIVYAMSALPPPPPPPNSPQFAEFLAPPRGHDRGNEGRLP